jgi:hypothetical protein
MRKGLQTWGSEMLRKYTRANLKLFGLRFNEPLFGRRTAGQGTLISVDQTNGGFAEERANPDDPGSERWLRRRRRETH